MRTDNRKLELLCICSIIVLLIIAVFAPPVSSQSQKAKSEIIIGVAEGRTGFASAFGIKNEAGLRLAEEDINKSGGIKSLNANIKIKVLDTESKIELAGVHIERFHGEGVPIFIGCSQSSATVVAAQAAARLRMPMIVPVDTEPMITSRSYKYVFRISVDQFGFASNLLDFLDYLGAKTGNRFKSLVVLMVDVSPGPATGRSIEAMAGKFGYKVLDSIYYPPRTTADFIPIITRIKRLDPEVLLCHSYPNDAALITRAMKDLDYQPKGYLAVVGGHRQEDFSNAIGDDVNYTIVSDYWQPDIKTPAGFNKVKEVSDRCKAQFGFPADGCVATGYMSLITAADALNRAGSTDREKVLAALKNTDIKWGHGNNIAPWGVKFDEKGDNARWSGVVFQWQHKTPVTVYPEELASGKVVWPRPAWKDIAK